MLQQIAHINGSSNQPESRQKMKYMKNATLRQLQIFESIARLGSFTAAANELHLTQPTISMQMKKLAELINTSLFHVHGKRVFLTDAGKELVPMCRSIFKNLEMYEDMIKNIKEVGHGELSISGVTTSEYFAPRILGDFIRRYPGITTSLEVTNRARVLDRLKNRSDDLYIIGQLYEGLEPELEMESVPFLDNPLVVFAAPEHRLAEERHIPFSELEAENFLNREEGCGTSMVLDRFLGEQGATLRSTMRLGSNEAIKQGVKSGLGISMLSQLALVQEIENGDLVVLDVEGFPILDQWHLAYPKGGKLSTVADAFFNFVQERKQDYARTLLPSRRRRRHSRVSS